jgi:NAD+ diphosphatase
MRRPNFFSEFVYDRAAHIRGDEDRLRQLLDTGARIIPVWRSMSLLARLDQPQALLLERVPPEEFINSDTGIVFLGLFGGVPHFAVDTGHAEDAPARLGGEIADLRDIGGHLAPEEASVLAHARAMVYWHERHRFCGVCGSPTVVRDAGHRRDCTNPDCGTPHFPRTDPAVIMLIHRGDRCLLGHSKRWSNPMYSTLAGFVEPGESLEDAVRREVMEEAGVKVGRVTYHSSQPWPFPASIMLGFYGEAESDEISIDDDELQDARWFTRDQLRNPEGTGIQLPRAISVSRRLINDWLEEG